MIKKKLLYLLLIALLVLLLTAGAASFLTSRTIGWPGLLDLLQLHRVFPAGQTRQYEIKQSQELDLAGIRQIKIKAINEIITVQAGKDQARAQLEGSYKASTELTWQLVRQDDQLLLEIVYPRFGLHSSDLALTIQLPASFTGGLEIDTVSGQVDFPDSFSDSWSSLTIKTVTADINIASLASQTISLESVAGQINLTGKADEISCETVSGAINVACQELDKLFLESVSGAIELCLAGESDLGLVFSSVSGQFFSEKLDFSSFSQHKGQTRLQIGRGSGQAEIETISGDFAIRGCSP